MESFFVHGGAGRRGGKGGLGDTVLTKFRNRISTFLNCLGTVALLALAGCGGGSSNTNVVSVAVSPASGTIIVSQSVTLTSVVSGTTNLNVTWKCEYETTTTDSSNKPVTSSKSACTSASGNIPDNSTNTTVTYTAPSIVPDPTKIPGNNCTTATKPCVLSVVITATSVADPKKSGSSTLSLDSGITVTLTPTTASVPTSVDLNTKKSTFQFSAALTNDPQPPQGVTWLITQATLTTGGTYPTLATCDPTCGSIDANGLYTAPTTVPTTATVTLVVTSKADNTRFALGTITITKGLPVTFNGISPTVVPQGASFYDVYIDAPNMTSASFITLTGTASQPATKNSASGQIKILFPIPTTALPAPPSSGARLRLNVSDLSKADTYTVAVFDPAQCTGACPLTTGHGPIAFQVQPVRPTSVASIPDSVPQNSLLPNEITLALNGGYFGPSGSLTKITFNGNDLSADPTKSASRQLNLQLGTDKVSSIAPGLYPLSLSSTITPAPNPANPSVTNLAIYPDYSTVPPSLGGLTINTINLGATTKPSAIDIDTRLGVIAVAEAGANKVVFYDLNNLSAALPCPISDCSISAPTGLSINPTLHTVAVVSPQDNEVRVLRLPCPAGIACITSGTPGVGQVLLGDPNVTYPVRISLAGLLPTLSPAPLPYSVGVDADTNMALVAYSSNATPTTAKVGFLLDLAKDSQTCLAGAAQTTPPCVHAQVTLNTGSYPQIASLPHSHLALVTPGGSGVMNGIDFTKSSTQLPIKNLSLTSGLVTVTVDLPAGQTLGLNPGNPGTVLIQGVDNANPTSTTKWDGAFTVQSVINSTSFTYALTSTTNDTASCHTDTTSPTDLGLNPCQVYFSSPNVTIGVPQTSQGIAINPITRVVAISDANATGANGPQIDLLNSLDQSISSINFNAGCTQFTTSCSNGPELLGTSSVAFQPYTNSLVSYNPQQNQLSVSNPVTLRRTAIACNAASPCAVDPTVPGQITLPGTGTDSIAITGTSTTLNLFGGLAVDPVTNRAFVVQSGSGTIQVISLAPTSGTTLKAAQITELQVPTVSGTNIGGIAGATMPQGTLVSSVALANVQIFGSGFDGSTQVRLDGTAVPSVQLISSRNLKFTVPASFLAGPHHYSVDVINGSGVRSNSTDFFVIKSVDLSTACSGSMPQPSSVGIADQLPGQGFAPIAVVSNFGCNNVAVININPQDTANFGKFSTIATGSGPQGVAVSPRFGLAVVANNTSGTASVLDLATKTQKVAAVTIGTTPTGVAIDEGTGTALITNTGSNTVSELNLALLFGSSAATTLSPVTIAVDLSPIAVAIDPDRGTNNRGLAVVTALQASSQGFIGVLDAVDIGGTAPAKSTTASLGFVSTTPTGIVFDSSRSPALFYANSSGGNVVTSYNPDGTTSPSTVHVGINPTSLAINPQTGGIMTINSLSQTVSIIDTISNPFKTRSTFGLGGSPQFGIAIDQFLNLAVLVDQANNRVLIFPVPN